MGDHFDDVMVYVEHTYDNTYAVIDERKRLAGVIRFGELSQILFDHELDGLVVAEDLAVPARWVLHPEDTLEQAWQLFKKGGDDCIPVVQREDPYRYVGMVRRRDVLRIAARGPSLLLQGSD